MRRRDDSEVGSSDAVRSGFGRPHPLLSRIGAMGVLAVTAGAMSGMLILRSDASGQPAKIVSPAPGEVLTSPAAWFSWQRAGSATAYRLLVGRSRGSGEYGRTRLLGKGRSSASLGGIPRDGSHVWVTLKTRQDGRWHATYHRYRAPLWKHLLECKQVADVPKEALRLISSSAGLSRFASYLRYDMRVCRVKYTTTFKGLPIIASGLVSYPLDSPSGIPVAVMQNGLIFSDREAPSAFSISVFSPADSRYVGYEFMAAAGYCVILPDWIGFGASKEELFPMYDRRSTASASIDMMKAAFEFTRSAKVSISDKLFIGGYSMGGYAANCLLQAVERGRTIDRRVTAAALGAGGYNLPQVMERALSGGTEARTAQVALFLTSYNSTNGWDRPLTDFFREPHASRMPRLLSGKYDTEQLADLLPEDASLILNPDFVRRVNDGRETRLAEALERNSIHNWAPASKVRLFHSRSDERIDFADSWEAYQNMLAGGSTQAEFVEIPEGDHFNAVFGFMELVLPWWESLR